MKKRSKELIFLITALTAAPILIQPDNLSTADKNQVGEYLERVTGIAWTTIV